MIRRSRGSTAESAELNLTSFLDLIFNILAFFVITFDPGKPEKNFDLSLPPPKEGKSTASASGAFELPIGEPALFEDVTITLSAGPGGSLSAIRLGGNVIQGGTLKLVSELRAIAGSVGAATGNSLEAANIVADPSLQFTHIISIVDACHQANIHKVNFQQPRAPQP